MCALIKEMKIEKQANLDSTLAHMGQTFVHLIMLSLSIKNINEMYYCYFLEVMDEF
jgi:hypothetical protein